MTIQTVIETIDSSDPNAKFYGQKPWFIKQLPSRIEVLEAANFDLSCRVGRGGSKPWFVKPLPKELEVVWGDTLEAKCQVTDNTSSIISEAKANASEAGTTQEELKAKQSQNTDILLAPASLKVIQITATSVAIQWAKPLADGGKKILHYILEKRESGQTSWETLTTLPPSVLECELENLAPGKEYYIRVRAENQNGVSEPMETKEPIKAHTLHTGVPGKPGIPRILEVGLDFITLTWDLPATDGGCPITHFLLERRETRGPQWVRVQKTVVQAPPFTIKNLVAGTEYEFQVSAKNVMGFSESSEMSKSVVTTETDVEPPCFSQEMKDVAVEEGEKAWFECRVTGLPGPDVRWFKNFKEVFDGYKHKVQRTADKCVLVVTNVGPDDCGEVECRAYNAAGIASNRAQLSLQAPAKLKVSPLIYGGLNFHRGEKIRIRIPIDGIPSPTVTWVKDGEVLEQSQRIEITESAGVATLFVHDAEKSDSGKYEIRIENPLASDRAEFDVFVQDRPDPPSGKPTVSDIEEDSCRVEWQVPPHDGGASIVSYTLHKQEVTSSGKWERVGSTHLTHLTVHRLKENKQYRFRVVADNVHGTSDPSEETDTIILQQSKPDIDYDRLVIQDNVYSRVNPDKLPRDLHGKYIICEELGRGSFGVVHRVIERKTGKCWAAKFLKTTPLEKPMLKHEMEILNELHHPKLLKLREAFDVPGECVMVLEFLSGPDLFEKLVEADYKLTEENCINYLRQICQAVSHIHNNGIVHLDIKPENVIFVTKKSENLKLIDFGLAQYVNPDKHARVLFGSPEFCAPEVLGHKHVSFCSDMWSLGVLAYVLLSGISPFKGVSKEDTVARILDAAYDFSHPIWSQISEEGRQWVSGLLQKDTRKRMTIGQAMAHPWLNGETEGLLEGCIYLPTELHTETMALQEWRKKYRDVVSIGRLAHMSPIFRRMASKKTGFERELVMELPDCAPQVVNELNNLDSYEGTTARFKCKIHGKPLPKIQWYHEGELLPSTKGGKYQSWFKRGLAMLNVNGVNPDDAGQYTCVATNSVGSSSTIGELNVQELMWRRSRSPEMSGRRRHSLSIDRESTVSLRRSCSVDRMNSMSLDSTIPPKFVLPLMDQTLRVGDKLVLNVQVSCRPDAELAWFHGQQRILSCDWCTLETKGSLSTLTVHSLTDEDAGDWRVLAINAYGQAVTVGKVTVLENVPANFTPPKITHKLEKSVVFEGNATKFECGVTGFPDPEVIWLRNRRPIAEDFRYESFLDENRHHCLVIREVYQEDSGHYTCMAVNQAGSVFSEAELVVECLDYESIYEISRCSQRSTNSIVSDLESVYSFSTTTSSGSRRRSKRLEMAPQFTAKLRPKRTYAGQTVRFNCSVSALPMPEVVWMKGNTRILGLGRFHVSHNYGLVSLEISKVQKEDSGLYTIKISNSEGEAACSATLEVRDVVRGQSIDKDEGRKPWFILEPQNIWLEVGQRAVFEAQATGKPSPTFKWMKDNEIVSSDSRVKEFSDDQGNCKLVISDADHSDTGMYFCVSENSAGKTKSAASLRVVDKGQLPSSRRGSLSRETTPRLSRSVSRSRETTPVTLTRESRESTPTGLREHRSDGVAPWFSHTLSPSLHVHEGDPVELHCVVDGDPKPKVIWLKEPYRELRHGRHHSVIIAGDKHALEIKSARKQDKGRYLVVAENSVGRVQASCWVDVLPPREYDSEGIEVKKMVLGLPEYESSIEPTTKMAPMFIKQLPTEIREEAGQTLQVECRVSDIHSIQEGATGTDDTSTPVGVTKTKREISKTTVMESLVMVQKEEHLRLEKQHMDLIQGTEVTTLNQGQSSTEDLDVIQF